MNSKITSILSLCSRAKKLVSGEFSCEKSLQTGEACFVIIASDASENTKKKFINKAFFYEVETIIWGTKEDLSRSIGKNNRAVVIIIDEGFRVKIKSLIESDLSSEQI